MSKVKKLPEVVSSTEQLCEAIKTQKKLFIPPKQKMKDSIDNDAQYLMALGSFIQEAQKEINVLLNSQGKKLQAFRLQVELLEAVGKYQANEGLVTDKLAHYENIFLPSYEKELNESKEKFEDIYDKCNSAIKDNSDDDQVKRIKGFIETEVKQYQESELKDHEEYRNYVYKIFKRLYNKYADAKLIKPE